MESSDKERRDAIKLMSLEEIGVELEAHEKLLNEFMIRGEGMSGDQSSGFIHNLGIGSST